MSDQQFVVPAVPVLLPLWLVLTSAPAYRLMRRGDLTKGRLVLLATVATYVVAVLAVTVLPLQVALGAYANQVPWYAKLNLVPIVTIDPITFVLNIVLTAPVGVLAPLSARVPTARRAALVGLLVSLSIEVVQGLSNVVLSSGRTADVNDLLANTLGATLGWLALRRLLTLTWVTRLYDWLCLPRGTDHRAMTSGAAHKTR